MNQRICSKCKTEPTSPKNQWCKKCHRLAARDRKIRKSFIGPPLPPQPPKCPKCGVLKTDENFYREKTGKNAGRFTTYCRKCTALRKKQWENKNVPKKGEPGYDIYISQRRKRYKELRNRPGRKEQLSKKLKTRLQTVDARLRRLLQSAKGRARKKQIEYDLDFDFLKGLFINQESKCSLTGIKFCLNLQNKTKTVNPLSPSLDRIDPSGGYTKDNVRLILSCVNIALNQFGEEFFTQWATEFVSRLSVK